MEAAAEAFGWDPDAFQFLRLSFGAQGALDVARALQRAPSTTSVRFTGDPGSESAFQAWMETRLGRPWARHPLLDDVAVARSVTRTEAEGLRRQQGGRTGRVQGPPAKVVLVGRRCGEAVMRGADVFAPGVAAMERGIAVGDDVAVVADVGRTPVPRIGALDEELLESIRAQVPRLRDGPQQGKEEQEEEEALSRSLPVAFRLVAHGVAGMTRKQVFARDGRARGVAVSVTDVEGDVVPVRVDGAWAETTAVQFLPSMVASHALGVQSGDRVLDMCAAPGGKTAHLVHRLRRATAAAAASDQGRGGGVPVQQHPIVAIDRTRAKVDATRANLRRLGVRDEEVALVAGDSQQLCRDDDVSGVEGRGGGSRDQSRGGSDALKFPAGTFDRVLCDAPCSALGVRPRFLSAWTLGDLVGTATYQRGLLAEAARLLKPGGTLVYSTCTVSTLENEGNVQWVLDQHPLLRLRLVECAPRVPEASPGIVASPQQDARAQSLLASLAKPLPRGDADADVVRRYAALRDPRDAHLVQRFDPRHPDASIGFFIAKFVKDA